MCAFYKSLEVYFPSKSKTELKKNFLYYLSSKKTIDKVQYVLFLLGVIFSNGAFPRLKEIIDYLLKKEANFKSHKAHG